MTEISTRLNFGANGTKFHANIYTKKEKNDNILNCVLGKHKLVHCHQFQLSRYLPYSARIDLTLLSQRCGLTLRAFATWQNNTEASYQNNSQHPCKLLPFLSLWGDCRHRSCYNNP